MSKRCDQVRQFFSPYRDGDLSSAAEQEVREHLQACEGCAARYARFEDALHDLRTAPRHPIPRQFAQDILQQVEQGVTAEEGTAPEEVDELPTREAPTRVWMVAASRWAAVAPTLPAPITEQP